MKTERWNLALLYTAIYSVICQEQSGKIESACLGKCINKGTPCHSLLINTNCGNEHYCCMDVEAGTESLIDWNSIGTESIPSWTETPIVLDNYQTVTDFYTSPEYFSTASIGLESLDSCPGVCMSNEQSSLCQYPLQTNVLCEEGKTCCVTKEAAVQLHDSKVFEKLSVDLTESDCPGKCVHPSLVSTFCTNILSGFDCPMNSKCCDGLNEQIIPTSKSQCTGECLSSQYTYLCLPPFELVPATVECEGTSICCMKTEPESDLDAEIMDESNLQLRGILKSLRESGRSGGVLASDKDGRIYYVFQNGQFRPLKLISFEESLSSSYAHFADVEVEAGQASLFRDVDGVLYQLSISDTTGSSLTVSGKFNSEKYPLTKVRDAIVSMPDDGDDMQESFKDLVLPDEGEDIAQDSIPPGESALIRPPCPGNCISSMLRFTCNGNNSVYDGFTCTSRSVCCANVKDIEEHEAYLKSLSPYFKAIMNMNNGRVNCGVKGKYLLPKKDASIEEWCWQAAVINSQNQYICGATIIHKSWILTAAHCVTSALRQDEELYVRVGVADLTSTADNLAAQTRRALSIFVHHNHNSLSLDNDIALLKLQSPLSMTANVCSVCLPATGMPSEQEKCDVTGYGFLNTGGKLTLKLKESAASLVHDLDCIANVTDALSTVFILPANSFCAGDNKDKDSCQADAGAPLVCKTKDKYELIGIVSWGLGCGKDLPSVYVKVPSYINWINQIMSANAFLRALGSEA